MISAQQFLLSDQDSLAVAQGAVPQGLIAVYRSLGGGWELRDGKPFLPAEITTAMGTRTDWGGLLEPAAVQPMASFALLWLSLMAAALSIGVAGYYRIADLTLLDATLNASMILIGMGPVSE